MLRFRLLRGLLITSRLFNVLIQTRTALYFGGCSHERGRPRLSVFSKSEINWRNYLCFRKPFHLNLVGFACIRVSIRTNTLDERNGRSLSSHDRYIKFTNEIDPQQAESHQRTENRSRLWPLCDLYGFTGDCWLVLDCEVPGTSGQVSSPSQLHGQT